MFLFVKILKFWQTKHAHQIVRWRVSPGAFFRLKQAKETLNLETLNFAKKIVSGKINVV